MAVNGTDITEQQLLASLMRDDESALGRLFELHYPRLVNDVYRLLRDEDASKDLVQDIFVELWKKRHDLDIHTSLRAYLKRAAVNRALNYIKAQRRTLLMDDNERWSANPDTSPQEIDLLNRNETLEQSLYAAIETLPEKCRLVFSLSRFEQLSHKEIADQLNISVKTIENQITKAMKMLRSALVNHPDLSAIVILMIKWGGME
jgi:RNA polymerase sigma-70 factor, ECF subfamily